MTRLAGALIVLISLCGIFSTGGCNKSSTKPATPGGGTPNQVTISGFAFSALTVPMGTVVTWKNQDSVTHTATSDAGSGFSFNTGDIAPGATSTGVTFNQAGTFAYHCMHHSEMHGSITVQ